ncbi:MAG: helix-turn-helix domain-containing protein [Candidatus Izemoplasmatales bacterium]
MDHLGQNIQERRKELGMSQETLAERVGVSRQAISKWEREDGLPDLYNLKKLSEVLEVSIDALMASTPPKENETPIESIPVKDNRTALILIAIPSFLIAIGWLAALIFTLLFTANNLYMLISNDYIQLEYNLFMLSPFVVLGVVSTFLIAYKNLYFSKNTKTWKFVSVILYAFLLTGFIIAPFYGAFMNGAWIIISMILLLGIIICGLIGSILYQEQPPTQYNPRFDIQWRKGFRILLHTYIVCMFVLIVTVFVNGVLKNEYMVMRSGYVYGQVSTDTFQYTLDQSYENHIPTYSAYINYYHSFEQPVENLQVELWIEGVYLAGGSMTSIDGLEYEFSYSNGDYEVPTLIIEDYPHNNSSVQPYRWFLEAKLTYLLDGKTTKETISVELTRMDVGGTNKALWIWYPVPEYRENE